MAAERPKIDPRGQGDLLAELKSLIPFYTPEWKPLDGDPGMALAKIFIHMMALCLERFNRLPEKHLVAFLDWLGTQQLPAQPSRTPLTFVLSQGAQDHVLIPERSQVASGEVIFETEKNIYATPSRLKKAYAVDAREDHIYESPKNLVSGQPGVPAGASLLYAAQAGSGEIYLDKTEGFSKGDVILIDGSEYAVISDLSDSRVSLVHKLDRGHPGKSAVERVIVFELFQGKDLQEHLFYLGHKDLFNVNGKAKFVLEIFQGGDRWIRGLEDPETVRWQYWGRRKTSQENQGKEVLDWYDFEVSEAEACPEENGKHIDLLKDNEDELVEREIHGVKSRWIRCSLKKGKISEVWGMEVDKIGIEPVPFGAVSSTWKWESFDDLKKLAEFMDTTTFNPAAGAGVYLCPCRKDDRCTFYAISLQEKREMFTGGLKVEALRTPEEVLSFLREGRAAELVTWWKEEGLVLFLFYNQRKGTGGAEGWKGETFDTLEELVKFLESFLAKETVFVEIRVCTGRKDPASKFFVLYGSIPTASLPVTWVIKSFDHAEEVIAFLDKAKMEFFRIVNLWEDKALAYHLFFSHVRDEGKVPDLAFHNDMPLDLATEDGLFKTVLLPFGMAPKIQDTFYVASQEVLSKKGAQATMSLTTQSQVAATDVLLSWEYWNGRGWTALEGLEDKTNKMRASGEILFKVPKDLEETVVNGQENHWIRVKIGGGDYGNLTFTKEQAESGIWVADPGNIRPPKIESLTLSYLLPFEAPEHCLTYNNLHFSRFTERCKSDDAHPSPVFLRLEEQHPSFYLGFDRKLENGPVSIFFFLREQAGLADSAPSLTWEFYAGENTWAEIQVLDHTRGLTRTGTIEFVFPKDTKKTSKFGNDLYWIRAVDDGDAFVPKSSAFSETVRLPAREQPFNHRAGETFLPPCRKSILGAEWPPPEAGAAEDTHPKIEAIFLNTTWGIQVESIRDEILGSSSGMGAQSFSLAKKPVLSEEIWVDEVKSISEAEKKEILETGRFMTKETKDERGRTTEFWVRWEPVEDLFTSSGVDRHYVLDRVWGNVSFGDGMHGKIPPIGTDNLRSDYRSGGGSEGNLDPHEVKDLKTSIPFVDKAFNPLAAAGGAETESLEAAMLRSPLALKHRDRAVAAEDYEQLCYKASRAVARAKCLANFDAVGQSKPGWVSVLIIPHSVDEKPSLSLQLKQEVENYLRVHAPNILVDRDRLRVSGPLFVEVSVSAMVITPETEAIPVIHESAPLKLRQFLHPLTGGRLAKGWDFGLLPCAADFFSLLEGIEGVDHVTNLSVTLRTPGAATPMLALDPASLSDVDFPSYAVICSGDHKIAVEFDRGRDR